MNQQAKNSNLLPTALFLLYIIIFASLIFSWRAISSSSIGMLIVVGIIYNRKQTGKWLAGSINNPFFLSCLLYFIFQFTSFFQSKDLSEEWRQIILKTGLVFIPLLITCCSYVNVITRKKLMTSFILLLAIACVICLSMAGISYSSTYNSSIFFYHQLVSPIKQHAIYFSLIIFFALLYLLESSRSQQQIFNVPLQISSILFFSAFLVLLSSRLVISFYIIYVLYYLLNCRKILWLKKKMALGIITLLVGTVAIIFATRNPVSNRFNEVWSSNLSFIQQNKYDPGDYFNGFQFRLLQWKLVPEILSENDSWLTGVGAGNSQELLNQKYLSKNMYRGESSTTDTGYLLYNTHNQLLESLLKYGIPGAILFLFICAALIQLAWKKKSRIVSFTVLLILLYCLNEAMLETQYGILIFTFFPLFFSNDKR